MGLGRQSSKASTFSRSPFPLLSTVTSLITIGGVEQLHSFVITPDPTVCSPSHGPSTITPTAVGIERQFQLRRCPTSSMPIVPSHGRADARAVRRGGLTVVHVRIAIVIRVVRVGSCKMRVFIGEIFDGFVGRLL